MEQKSRGIGTDDGLQNDGGGRTRLATAQLRLYLLPPLAVGGMLLALFAVLVVRSGGKPSLVGTDLGKRPAPNFMLIDQRGQTVRLSDLSGKAVALTFIYTNCPDVCPATARSFRAAHEQLPPELRDEVAFVAVALDPARDTQAALQAFSAQHGLADNPNWYALRGDPATLDAVWRTYGIYPGTSPTATPVHRHDSVRESASPLPGGGIGHTDAVYLIDPDGRERVLMRAYVDPGVLAANLKALVD